MYLNEFEWPDPVEDQQNSNGHESREFVLDELDELVPSDVDEIGRFTAAVHEEESIYKTMFKDVSLKDKQRWWRDSLSKPFSIPDLNIFAIRERATG